MTLYDALLHLYPKSFRLEYGQEMRRMFAERRGGAAGVVALVSLWAKTLLDVIRNAVLVHGDILRQDMRFTLRALGRAPGFTATAILMACIDGSKQAAPSA